MNRSEVERRKREYWRRIDRCGELFARNDEPWVRYADGTEAPLDIRSVDEIMEDMGDTAHHAQEEG